MRTIVLVHGAWHGPWCWAPVMARLDEAGQRVVAVELELRDVHADAAIVTEAIEAVGGPVLLVGHSYGGVVITEAGVHPSVEHLVYVAAFAVDDDETPLGLVLDNEGDVGELGAAIVVHDDGTNTLDPAVVGAALYADCDAVDVERAIALLRPQGGQTLSQPVTAVAWKQVPSTYVLCGADRGVPPALQRRMAERMPRASVVEWPCSHSPFFSMPGELAALLTDLANVEGGPGGAP